MPDIIQAAQDLKSELKSEHEDWIRERGGENIEMQLTSTVMYGDEESREVIGALAEEEYQYGVTYTGVNHGGHHIEWVESTGDSELDEDRLQIVVKGWKQMGQSPKIVRRRISAPEVIE